MIKIKKRYPESPCIRICRYDEEFVCIGCGRTSEEISRWLMMSDEEREEILDRLKENKICSNQKES